ncbi:MAG: SoxR reducing system RseC family protein [Deltaproteobacteria bacterium]|jgi:sigma-E factor negative regulatory protein RseC|nr:SoxR reducing system RseC family protein [Deltaproteobacteria bacterium]
MSAEKGTVESIEGDWAWVLTRRKNACEHCGHKGHCHMIEGGDRMLAKARNAAHARTGDEVELFLSTKTKLKGLFILYMLPVLGLLIGAFSANSLSGVLGFDKQLGIVFFTLSGLIAAFLLARFLAIRMEANQQLIPIVTRVVGRYRGSHPLPTEIQVKGRV